MIKNDVINTVGERVFHYFREISKIPRGSLNEMGVVDYLVGFAIENGLEYRRHDEVIDGRQAHNVIICKPGTEGYDGFGTVILQAHIDMICQKTGASTHDFEKDPIKIIETEKNGEKVLVADGTTLGADDGIGVAFMLAILSNRDIAHPPIKALFTSDEESGMTGAKAVTREFIGIKDERDKHVLINIDTEAEGVMNYGCAGGVNAEFRLPISLESVPEGFSFVRIEISGLQGGHSGMDIHRNRANAHKLTARTLGAIQEVSPIRLVSFWGGDKRNVITREAAAVIGIRAADVDMVIDIVKEQNEIFLREYKGVEDPKNFSLTARKDECGHKQALSLESSDKLISMIIIMPDGVLSMHGETEGLVETSCNLGIVRQESSEFYICSLIRSFFKTKKLQALDRMRRIAKLTGAEFYISGDYPNWEPDLKSELIDRFDKAYRTLFPQVPDTPEELRKPRFESVHAGLECGYFSEKFPGMDMIACGPTITGAHSPDETLYVDSVKKVAALLVTVLGSMNE